jgi:hypothetical protein
MNSKNIGRLDFESPPTELETISSEYVAVIASLRSKFKEQPVVLEQNETAKKMRISYPEMQLSPDQRLAVVQSMEKAMAHMGRTGKEIFLGILYKRYGVVKQDMVDSPSKFMGALRIFLGSSASVIERYALDELETRLKISASSLEEAVAILKGQADLKKPPERIDQEERETARKGRGGKVIHIEYRSSQ